MVTALAALDQSLTAGLAIQHLIFPFQTWIGYAGVIIEVDGGSTLEALAVWVSITIVYSVAASTTINNPLPLNVVLKTSVMTVVSGIAVILNPRTWAVAGLIVEAAVSGLFESWTFDAYLSSQFGPRPRRSRQMKLLALVIAGFLLIPRALSLLGVGTHLLHHEHAVTGFLAHPLTILMNGLVNEGLIWAQPSTFARLWMIKLPSGLNVVSRQPVTSLDIGSPSTSRTLYRITALYQIGICIVVWLIWNFIDVIISAVIHPLSTFLWHKARFSQAQHSVRRMEVGLKQGLRLFSLGERKGLRELLVQVWAQADILTVLSKMVDIQFALSYWGYCIAALYIGLTLCWLLYAKIERFYSARY